MIRKGGTSYIALFQTTPHAVLFSPTSRTITYSRQELTQFETVFQNSLVLKKLFLKIKKFDWHLPGQLHIVRNYLPRSFFNSSLLSFITITGCMFRVSPTDCYRNVSLRGYWMPILLVNSALDSRTDNSVKLITMLNKQWKCIDSLSYSKNKVLYSCSRIEWWSTIFEDLHALFYKQRQTPKQLLLLV